MPEAAPTASRTTGQRVDPIRNYTWKIFIDKQAVGDFVQCSGLDISVDSMDYYEGGSPYARKVAGRTHYAPITLEYGLTRDRSLWDWMQNSVKQNSGDQQGPVRKDVAIVMLSPDGSTELLRWNLFAAWPSRLRAKPLDAASSQYAVLVLELSFDYAEQD
jgi:phage tail-like protein